ncbi:FixH family protein [Phycisphaeraceae bacterium D3-23]
MPAVVFGFLGAHMVFIFTAITLAVGDRSFAVVPDYYQKAVDWDEHKAELAASAALGWQAEVTAGREVSTLGERPLTLDLHDAGGTPITGAQVSATLYPVARAKQVITVELSPVADTPGRYSASPQMCREGTWDLSIRVERAGERYVHEQQLYAVGTTQGVRP